MKGMIRRFLWSLQRQMRGSGVQLQPWTVFTVTPNPTWFSILLLWMILWITWGNDLFISFPQCCKTSGSLRRGRTDFPWNCVPLNCLQSYMVLLIAALWQGCCGESCSHSLWKYFRDGEVLFFPVGLYATGGVGVCWWRGCKNYFLHFI